MQQGEDILIDCVGMMMAIMYAVGKQQQQQQQQQLGSLGTVLMYVHLLLLGSSSAHQQGCVDAIAYCKTEAVAVAAYAGVR